MSWTIVLRSLAFSALLMLLVSCVLSVWLIRRTGPNAWQDVTVLNRTEAPVDLAGIHHVPGSDFGVISPGQSVARRLRIGDMSPGYVTVIIRRPDGSRVSKQIGPWIDDDALHGDSVYVVIDSVSP